MELVTNHRIYYSNKNAIPIGDIADSLLALDRLIQNSPTILENLFPGVKIDNIKVYIQKIETGSLFEEIIVKLFFCDQTELDNFIAKVRKNTGMEKLQKNNQLLSAIILASVLFGGTYALSKITSAPEQKTQIEANNNVIINIGAGMVEMTPDDFRAIVETSITNKKELAQNAIKFVSPAKKEFGTTITFDDNPEIELKKETISSFPSYIPNDAEEEILKDFYETKIIIRATDLDNLKRGWAVVVPELGDKRIQLQLSDNINPTFLSKQDEFNGNITVLFKTDENGISIPRKVYLREITTEKTANE